MPPLRSVLVATALAAPILYATAIYLALFQYSNIYAFSGLAILIGLFLERRHPRLLLAAVLVPLPAALASTLSTGNPEPVANLAASYLMMMPPFFLWLALSEKGYGIILALYLSAYVEANTLLSATLQGATTAGKLIGAVGSFLALQDLAIFGLAFGRHVSFPGAALALTAPIRLLTAVAALGLMARLLWTRSPAKPEPDYQPGEPVRPRAFLVAIAAGALLTVLVVVAATISAAAQLLVFPALVLPLVLALWWFTRTE